MSIPNEVILDLLPVYLADEVSPATRQWFEEYLAQNPELAERVRRHRAEGLHNPALPPLPPELELRALQETRSRMTKLRWLFGLAIGFSLMPLSLEIDFHPLRVHFLVMDYPGQLMPCFVVGMVCWIAYFTLRRRLRSAGV